MKKEALWYYEFREIEKSQYTDGETSYRNNWQVMTAKEFDKYWWHSFTARQVEIWHITRRKASLAEQALRRLPDYQRRLEADLNGKD